MYRNCTNVFNVAAHVTKNPTALFVSRHSSRVYLPVMSSHRQAIEKERAAASFNTRELFVAVIRANPRRMLINIAVCRTYIIDGGEDVTRRKEAMAAIVESDPVFDLRKRFRENYEQQYLSALAKMKRMRELSVQLKLDAVDLQLLQGAVNDSIPSFLHEVAFIPTIKGQADAEQRAKWLGPAENYAIIGCCTWARPNNTTFRALTRRFPHRRANRAGPWKQRPCAGDYCDVHP